MSTKQDPSCTSLANQWLAPSQTALDSAKAMELRRMEFGTLKNAPTCSPSTVEERETLMNSLVASG